MGFAFSTKASPTQLGLLQGSVVWGFLADGSATSGPQLCVPGTGTMFEFFAEILLDMFLVAFS